MPEAGREARLHLFLPDTHRGLMREIDRISSEQSERISTQIDKSFINSIKKPEIIQDCKVKSNCGRDE